jgi:hypothetical protein
MKLMNNSNDLMDCSFYKQFLLDTKSDTSHQKNYTTHVNGKILYGTVTQTGF